MQTLKAISFQFLGNIGEAPDLFSDEMKQKEIAYENKLSNHFKEIVDQMNNTEGYLRILVSKDGVLSTKPLSIGFTGELKDKIDELLQTFHPLPSSMVTTFA